MRFVTNLVELFARNRPFLGNHLRRDALVEHNVVVALHDRRAEGETGAEHAIRAHRDSRHRFDAGSNDDVVYARHHGLGCEVG